MKSKKFSELDCGDFLFVIYEDTLYVEFIRNKPTGFCLETKYGKYELPQHIRDKYFGYYDSDGCMLFANFSSLVKYMFRNTLFLKYVVVKTNDNDGNDYYRRLDVDSVISRISNEKDFFRTRFTMNIY